MSGTTLYIYGAGGHGRVILDLATTLGLCERMAFLDEEEAMCGRELDGVRVLGRLSELPPPGPEIAVAVAVGLDNARRLSLHERLSGEGYALPALVHPRAWVAESASIGPGTVIMANAAVGVGATIGAACIVNTSASVDHDCVLEDGVHAAPGATLCGGVHVGRLSLVGSGASVIQGISIGEACVIGAGAAVVEHLPANATALGVPAKVQRKVLKRGLKLRGGRRG